MRTWVFIVVLGAFIAAAFASTCHAIAGYAATFAVSRGLPVAVVPPAAAFPARVSAWIVGCALLEGIALWLMARLLPATAAPRATAAAVMTALAVMSTISWNARGSLSIDAYTYMQYANAPSFGAAYAPAAGQRLPSPFRSPGIFAGPKAVPCVYGPLWLAADRALLAGARTQTEAFERLRAAAIVELGIFVALLAAAGVDGPALLALALCPALYEFFVVEAHNDLLALVILALASVVLRTPLRAAAAFVAGCAALVKLNFALLALATLARPQSPRRRLWQAVTVVAIALLGSELFAGSAYFAAIGASAGHRGSDMSDLKFYALEAIRAVAAAIAVLTLLAAFARDRWWRCAAWTLPALASGPWPWYASWGLPFALRIPRFGAVFVASLPLVAAMLDRAITMGFKLGLVAAYLIAAIGLALAHRLPADSGRSRFPSERRPRAVFERP
jgi:hypothetical protein